MKLINFFNKLSPLVKTAIIAGTIGILIIAISSIFIIQGLEKKYNSSSNSNTSLLISPTPLIGADNPTATPDPYEGWKEYYFEPYDITIKYPPTFNIESNPSPGNLNCTDIKSSLKDPINCKNTILFPSFETLNKNNSSISIFGPTPSGIGGYCDGNYNIETLTLLIKDISYSYVIKKMSDGSYCSLDYKLSNVIATGNKSPWKNFNIQINSKNKEDLKSIINILSSIK